MSVSSAHVNLLIYHYLKESGFLHASFALDSECRRSGLALEPCQVPTGALVHYLQKGLTLAALETHVRSVFYYRNFRMAQRSNAQRHLRWWISMHATLAAPSPDAE